MVLSFTGEHTQKVDGKGRMSIPADFRRVLESGDPAWTTGVNPRLYVLYGDHLKKTLHVYTIAAFTEIADQINAMPRGSAARTRMSRWILGQSMKLEVDKDGRVVMPIRQRQKLGMTEGEVYFTGVGDHFEIWEADTFNSTVGDPMKSWLNEQPDGYDPLSELDG